MHRQGPDSLFSNLCYLGAARAAVICLNLIATSRLAHALGADNFGINTFATSYVAYFLIVVNLGFETFLTREIAFDGTRLRAMVSSIMAMRLLIATVMTILLFVSLPILRLSVMGQTVILIQGIGLFTGAIGLTAAYQGLQRMRVVAGREVAASVANAAGILLLVHNEGDLMVAAWIAVGTQLMTNGAILAHYATEFGIPRLRLPGRSDFQMARQSMTFFWSMLMITVTYNTHIVMLGLMRSETEVGLFSAGWKLFIFAIAVPNLIATLFMPRIANLKTQIAERERSMEFFLKTIIVCAIPITMFGSLLTPQILILLFGPAYLRSSATVVLLLLNALVVAVNIGFGTSMLAVGRQNAFLRVVVAGAGVGVVLNAILIPLYGGQGAAVATLIDESVILGLLFRGCPEMPGARVIDFTIRCVLAIIPAASVVHFVPLLPVIQESNLAMVAMGGAAGGMIYVLALRLLRIDLLHFAADLRRLQ
jgi:O-antigen/teichoic acid export membrane protein